MSSAGQRLVAGRIPGERIATTTGASDSATFTTTETTLDSITVPMVSGRTYGIWWFGAVGSTTTDSTVLLRLREDDTSGTVLNEVNYRIDTTGTAGVGMTIQAEFTAAATGDQVIVATGIRNGGTGDLHAEGAATRIRYLYADYISG